MKKIKIGTVKEIYRYPVKSMAGEQLDHVVLNQYGVFGDRSFALKLKDKYLTVEKLPELLNYKASLIEKNGLYNVNITTESGHKFLWTDDNLLTDLSSKLKGQTIEKIAHDPLTEEGANWEDHLLLTTSSSLKDVSSLVGKDLLDMRRFRPNIVIELEEDEPYKEEQWLGKQLLINNTVININDHCPRCFYINVDPCNPANIESTILKTIVKERNRNFGVYASVKETGEIFEGAEIYLIEDTY